MKVVSLWRMSTLPVWPHAMQRWLMVPFFTETIYNQTRKQYYKYNLHTCMQTMTLPRE
jgi:hypothetical protein